MVTKHYVYILTSINNPNKVYVGYTTSLSRRLKEHNTGLKCTYSKRHAPWQMESYLVFQSEQKAQSFETYLKSGSGQAFLKKRFLP